MSKPTTEERDKRKGAAGWCEQRGGDGDGSTGSRDHPQGEDSLDRLTCQLDSTGGASAARHQGALWLELQAFLADLQSAHRRPGTRRFYEQKIEPFICFLANSGIEAPEQLTATAIRRYMMALAETHSPGGCHAYWRAIRAFTRFLLREGVLERDPMVALRAPRVDQEPLEPVSLADVQAMVATCRRSDRDLRDASILVSLVDTGLRAGEAVALNVSDLDVSDGSILIRSAKNHTPRVVVCGASARRALTRYLRLRPDAKSDEPLWLAYHSEGLTGRLTYSGLREIIRRRARLAGIQPPTLHSFRRAFAIEMLRNGADLITLGRMMGHGSLPVLKRYLRQDKTDLVAVHRICSPADRLTKAGRGQQP